MKLTKGQLRQIIKEELEQFEEAQTPTEFFGDIYGQQNDEPGAHDNDLHGSLERTTKAFVETIMELVKEKSK